jgi:hypothetical protein
MSPRPFSIRQLRFQGKPIAALLVKPVPVGNGCLIATQNGEERLLKRVEGTLGRVESLRGRVAIPEYERTRRPLGEDLGSFLARFLKRVEKGGTQDDDLEAAIEAWHRRFQKKNADLQTTFNRARSKNHADFIYNLFCPSTAWPTGVQITVGQPVRFSVYLKFEVQKYIRSYAGRNLNVLLEGSRLSVM